MNQARFSLIDLMNFLISVFPVNKPILKQKRHLNDVLSVKPNFPNISYESSLVAWLRLQTACSIAQLSSFVFLGRKGVEQSHSPEGATERMVWPPSTDIFSLTVPVRQRTVPVIPQEGTGMPWQTLRQSG